jgi:RHS repeat-associated protein
VACLTDGNKNIIGLMEANGEISAKFAYSPFGKLLSSQGADVAESSFGFSSEYRDTETSLVYYNFRYMDTKLGRWLTRDPAGELGFSLKHKIPKQRKFETLYGFVLNSPIINLDSLGLANCWPEALCNIACIAAGGGAGLGCSALCILLLGWLQPQD